LFVLKHSLLPKKIADAGDLDKAKAQLSTVIKQVEASASGRVPSTVELLTDLKETVKTLEKKSEYASVGQKKMAMQTAIHGGQRCQPQMQNNLYQTPAKQQMQCVSQQAMNDLTDDRYSRRAQAQGRSFHPSQIPPQQPYQQQPTSQPYGQPFQPQPGPQPGRHHSQIPWDSQQQKQVPSNRHPSQMPTQQQMPSNRHPSQMPMQQQMQFPSQVASFSPQLQQQSQQPLQQPYAQPFQPQQPTPPGTN